MPCGGLTGQRRSGWLKNLLLPVKVACENHAGSARARVHQWDGKAWQFVSDWIESGDVKEFYLGLSASGPRATVAPNSNAGVSPGWRDPPGGMG